METDLLASLIDQKHQVLVQLRFMSQRQASFVTDGQDMGPLLGLLAAKQQLIEQLGALESQLDPFRQQDPEWRIWRSQTERARCHAVAQQCKALLDEIMVVEQQSIQELTQRRTAVAAQLATSTSASQACSAYADEGPGRIGILDLTSEA